MSSVEQSLLLANHITIGRSASLPRSMQVEVIFGQPRHNCQGMGICRIVPSYTHDYCTCPCSTAWLSLTPTGHLRLSFDRSTLLPIYAERYFGQQVFHVREAYTFPQALLFPLKMDFFTIQAGIYTVQETVFFLIVDL